MKREQINDAREQDTKVSVENEVMNALLKEYVRILREFFGDRLESVALFGSLARRTARFPGSDIDILIVMEGIEGLSMGKRLKLTMEVEENLRETEEYNKFKEIFGCSPDFQEVVFTPEELKRHPPVLLDMTTDAIILCDDGILSEELDKIRKRLRELGARKIEYGDSWFWILKPDVEFGEEVEI